MAGVGDEIEIDYGGTNLARTVGNVTFDLDIVPDFGIFQSPQDRMDMGELGMVPVGVRRPVPRNVAFMIKGVVDSAITDPVTRWRELMAGWGSYRRQFSPSVGRQELGATVHDESTGADRRRFLRAEPMEAPSYRQVYEPGMTKVGLRLSGRLKYLARLEAVWPWFFGAEQSVAVDTSVTNTYDVPNDGERSTGWRLYIAGVTGDPSRVTLEFDGGQVLTLGESSGDFKADTYFDWFHTDPQNWSSVELSGPGGTPVTYGALHSAGVSGNAGRILTTDDLGSPSQVVITPDSGTIAGTFYWYEQYEGLTDPP